MFSILNGCDELIISWSYNLSSQAEEVGRTLTLMVMSLRETVNKHRYLYNQAKTGDKIQVTRMIVSALRQANPPSRFLCRNEETRLWEDVGDKRAVEKVGQLIRKNDEDKKIGKQTAFVKNAVTCRERDQATRWDGILIRPGSTSSH